MTTRPKTRVTPRNHSRKTDDPQAQVDLQPAILYNKTVAGVIGYCRVSSLKQADEGQSLHTQRRRITGYCEALNLQLTQIIEDDGYSGKDINRPGLKKAIAMLQSGAVSGIVITRLDRLTRSVKDLSHLLEDVFSSKDLISLSDSIDTRTPTGRLMLNVLTSVGQWEREVTAQRTKDGVWEVAAECGGWCWGQLPYGYVWGPRDESGRKTLLPHEGEQAVIQRIRELAQAGTYQRVICAALNTDGIPSKRGGKWHVRTLRELMIRERITPAGPINNPTGRPKGNGTPRRRPLSPWTAHRRRPGP